MTATRDDGDQAVRDLIHQLIDLSDEASRLAFIEDHPELGTRRSFERLSKEVLRSARDDLDQARRLVEAERLLADSVGDDYCQAVSHKDLANVLYLTGRYEDALANYRAAWESFFEQGAEVEGAITLSSSIQSHSYLGRYSEAMATADRARAVFERHGDPLLLARLDTNVANVLVRQDRHDEALKLYLSARKRFEQGGEPQDLAAALYNIAVCRIELNDFPGALEAYRELKAHCERHGMAQVAIRADYNIAYLHYLRGEFTRALELYQRTRGLCRRHNDPYHRALCDLDQAEIYLELNLTSEGDRLARLALSAFEELGMPYEANKALTFLAIAASRQGKAFRALELFDRARERFEKEENQVWGAIIDLYKALILDREGRSFEAWRLAESALTFFSGARLHTKAVLSELLLARIQLAAGEPTAARERCRSALERLETLELPALHYKAYFVLGQVEEELGRGEAAFEAYRAAHERLESLRSHLKGEELKINFLKDKLAVYENLVWMTLAGEPTAEEQRQVMRYIEQAKSRGLADLLAFRAQSLPPSTSGPSELVERMRRLREELNWYYRQIDLAELRLAAEGEEDELGQRRTGPEEDRPAPPSKVAALREKSLEYERQLLKTLHEVHSTDTELGSLQAAGAVDLEAIRATLPSGALLLEYYEARGILYACLIGRDRLEMRPVATAASVQESQRRLQSQLSRLRLGREYLQTLGQLLETEVHAHLRELHRALLEPFDGRLEADHLIVVPHGPLHYLPFHALHDGEGYLMDRFPISYAPSASVFAMCREKRPATENRSLVLGVPDALTPHIRQEAEAVAASLPGARLCLGDEATEEHLRVLGAGCRFVHIATHGFFRKDNPMFSAIQLGGSRLTLFDLYTLELGAEMVALSGCGTGLNVVESGDELIGLTRGLLYGGAPLALVTLWDVHDASTAALMTSFYREIAHEANRAAALARAMRELRETYPHPYYWAPFVLIGDPFVARESPSPQLS